MKKPILFIKKLFMPKGIAPRRIKFGICKGLIMQLDLNHQSQIYLGLYEREIYKWLKKISSGINTAIDIGAAYGQYTLFFLKKTNSKKIISFEPEANCLNIFKTNLKLNGFAESERFRLIEKFVGVKEDSLNCMLDSFISDITCPCLFKIDVEGAEVDVLKGSRKILELKGISWLIETHSKQCEEDCIKILKSSGFDITIIFNPWWRAIIPELRILEHNRWLVAVKK